MLTSYYIAPFGTALSTVGTGTSDFGDTVSVGRTSVVVGVILVIGIMSDGGEVFGGIVSTGGEVVAVEESVLVAVVSKGGVGFAGTVDVEIVFGGGATDAVWVAPLD